MTLSDLIRLSLVKVVFFYGVLIATVAGLLCGKAERRLLVLAIMGGIPVLAFAVSWQGGDVERYMPLYPFVCAAWGLVLGGAGARPVRLIQALVLSLVGVMGVVNLPALSRASAERDRVLLQRRLEQFRPSMGPEDRVYVVVVQDPLFQMKRDPLVSLIPGLRVEVLIPLGYGSGLNWRGGFARRVQGAWSKGGKVWISKRVLSRPKAEWDWVEGDETSVSWSELPAFFGAFELGRDPGRRGRFCVPGARRTTSNSWNRVQRIRPAIGRAHEKRSRLEDHALIVAHLMTSPFFGGPERLVVGLSQSLAPPSRSTFLLFADKGKSEAFRRRLRDGWTGDDHADARHASSARHGPRGDSPALGTGCRHPLLPRLQGRHGRPAGGAAGGRARDRHVAWLDRRDLEGPGLRGTRSGLPPEDGPGGLRLGAARPRRSAGPACGPTACRHPQRGSGRPVRPGRSGRPRLLEAMFPRAPRRIVGSAGRLSPEKGFGVLVEAAAIVARSDPGAGFIHFGDGPLREPIRRRIEELGLEAAVHPGRASATTSTGSCPHWDLSVLPSFTEGLPTVVLESYAAGVPVVATAVGGTPEAVADGVDGYLVPPGDPAALAARVLDVLNLGEERKTMGRRGRARIRAEFTFEAQAVRFEQLCTSSPAGGGLNCQHERAPENQGDSRRDSAPVPGRASGVCSLVFARTAPGPRRRLR